MFAIRRETLELLFSSPEWSRRLEEAKTMRDVKRVFEDFCRRNGLRMAYVKEEASA